MKCTKCNSENVELLDEYNTREYDDESGCEIVEKNKQYQCNDCSCIFTIVR